MKFQIVTDSSANLPDELIEKYDLHILSLLYYIGENEYESYVKGKQTDLTEIYARMRNKEVFTTSCMSIGTCRSIFENILQQDKDLLYIGFSSALSATYQTSCQALEELRLEYPNRKILSVDTLAATLGEGLLVTYAAKFRKEGKTIEVVYDWLMENRLHLCHWFTVDDLFFLLRGGRVSASSALLGTILNIKPIIHVNDTGHLIPVGKVRGKKNSLRALLKRMEETAIEPENQTIYITHGDCLEDATYLADKIREKFGTKNILIHLLEPVIGSHCGPGTVTLFYLGTKR
ncbi:DegV family protein [Acetobacterium malicum]|uniref:DegV family protein n=1 Tax=Acetobacterium malicum TaxID=52692 RepID=UPI000419CDBA|nr:DegV family protein [Acetobacterium dehalogenans]